MTSTSWSGKTILVVANPLMRGDPQRVITALRRYAPPDVELEIRWTTPSRDLRPLIADCLAHVAAVIACGGDGTVADVVTALEGFDHLPVGIIPRGSTNVVARENGIPLDVEPAARLIFGEHAIAKLDVGYCLGRRFLHMGGAGLDSRLFCSTHPGLKRRIGWLAYLIAGAQNLFAPPALFTISTELQTIHLRSLLVLVANGAAIVRPSFPVYPGLRRDDGLLDVIAFTATTPWPIVRTIARFVTRRLAGSGDIVHVQCQRVEIAADPPLPVELDGDVVGFTPATVTVQPGKLNLIVPPASAGTGTPLRSNVARLLFNAAKSVPSRRSR